MISIIVPVYNAQEYLQKCLNSIRSQQEKEWELILVDDGSTDLSGKICDRFGMIDSRIRVIHKLNGGVSSARNVGIDNAIGEYIMFVDSDDWLENDLLKQLKENIQDADIVIGGYKSIRRSSEIINKAQSALFEIDDLGNYYYELLQTYQTNSPFSKLYKKEIIASQRFRGDIQLGEDYLFNMEYIRKCKKIKIVDTTGYIYNCMNESSATRKFREKDIEQSIELYNTGKAFCEAYVHNSRVNKLLENRFCINGINLLQKLFYSKYSSNKKLQIAKSLLQRREFLVACQRTTNLPLKYEVPRQLCLAKKLISLQYFFYIKKMLSHFRGG